MNSGSHRDHRDDGNLFQGIVVLLLLELLVVGIVMVACGVKSAYGATTITPLSAVTNQAANDQPSERQARRFAALVGWPWQRVGDVPFWTYVKGTRSKTSTYPESWYLHVDGVRVRDHEFRSYVMDPRNRGWQAHVAAKCPRLCFVDGLGVSSIGRTTPRLPWTSDRWIAAVVDELEMIVSTGDRILPNSFGHRSTQLVDVTGRGSTESFDGLDDVDLVQAGRVWVEEIGGCGRKLAAYLLVRERGDHFACYDQGSPPWRIPDSSKGLPLGKPLGGRRIVPTGWRRDFRHGWIVVRGDGSYAIRRGDRR